MSNDASGSNTPDGNNSSPQPVSTSQDPARVVANHGAELTLLTSSGESISATQKKKLGLVVTGDLVHWQSMDHGIARVTEVLERKSTLARTDRQGHAKPIATNISQVLVVTAPKPPFDTLLLDRYCVAASNIGADVGIVINKTDLLDDATSISAEHIESVYTSLGYPVARCCVKETGGLDQVKALLDDQITILVGQSGVGKSSILDALLPQHGIKTGSLSDNSGLGRHTTTVTNWYDLANNGAIIDSPGVRLFSLEHLESVDIQAGFREIADYSARCKFNDCTHQHEPDCAVLSALESGHIDRARYNHFLQLITGE